MDVKVSLENQQIIFDFLLDDEDGVFNERIKMDNTSLFIQAEEFVSIKDIHPDHLALGILLISNPFVKKELNIPFPVSQGFRDACKIITKYRVNFPSNTIDKYAPGHNSRPGLSFSGGADSTAALLLMPENTLSVFMDRPLRSKASLYNKSAAYATINHAREIGHDVRKISCNLEYIRSPIGFPTDLAPALPLILMSAKNNVDSIAFGTVLESAYRVGHEHCRNYETSGHYRVWGGLFDAANIPLYLPVAGISEVGTSKIVLDTSFRDYTRSCIRGVFPLSCDNCWKCFRKNLVEKRLINQNIPNSEMERWLNVREVKGKLQAWPISHENVLSWSLQGANTSGPSRDLLFNRTEGKIRNMDFLCRWYPQSIDLVPHPYKDITRNLISNYLDPMKEQEIEQIVSHIMTEWLTSTSAKEAKNIFDSWSNIQN
tara:strand:- start:4250 stop:5539 length:1290 start_codon:yes stop_codon:yes gene_type:complete